MAEKKRILRPNPEDTPRTGVNSNLGRKPTSTERVESGISSDMINPDGNFRERIPAQFDPMGPRVKPIKEVANQMIKQNLKDVAREAANKTK